MAGKKSWQPGFTGVGKAEKNATKGIGQTAEE